MTDERVQGMRLEGFTDPEIVEVLGVEAAAGGPGYAKVERDLLRMKLASLPQPKRGDRGRPGWPPGLWPIRRAAAVRELQSKGVAAPTPKDIATVVRGRGGQIGMTPTQVRALDRRFGSE